MVEKCLKRELGFSVKRDEDNMPVRVYKYSTRFTNEDEYALWKVAVRGVRWNVSFNILLALFILLGVFTLILGVRLSLADRDTVELTKSHTSLVELNTTLVTKQNALTEKQGMLIDKRNAKQQVRRDTSARLK